MIVCKTEAEARAALDKDENAEIEVAGEFSISISAGSPLFSIASALSFSVVAWGSSQPRVVAWGSSQPRVVAWGSSRPSVEARDISQPRVEARESSQPRVEAWWSSRPRVEARDISQPSVVAWGSSRPRVVARESSQPRVVARESSQPRVVAWESSQPRVVAWWSSQPRVEARGSSRPRVDAWDISQPSVVAWGSSRPRVEARDISQPSVVAWGSSRPRVVARESSQPSVEAWGYVQLSLFGRRISATASAMVSVLLDGGATCSGGNQVEVRRHTPEEWCSYYGLPVVDGVVTLFKALNSGFRSPYGGDYTPGTVPVAADWDGGVKECGGGLHFSPSPRAALEFNDAAVCFVACPVALADLSIHPDGSMPQKVKARGCCAPVWEVDEDGNRIERQQAAA